jgi:hypothetical protein
MSTDRLVQREKKIEHIHLMESVFKRKERKKENAANLHEVNGIILMRKRGNFPLIPRRAHNYLFFSRTRDFLSKMAFTFQRVCALETESVCSGMFVSIFIHFTSLHALIIVSGFFHLILKNK